MGLMNYIKQKLPVTKRAREIIRLKNLRDKYRSQIRKMCEVDMEDFSFATRGYMRNDIIEIRQKLTKTEGRLRYYEQNK